MFILGNGVDPDASRVISESKTVNLFLPAGIILYSGYLEQVSVETKR